MVTFLASFVRGIVSTLVVKYSIIVTCTFPYIWYKSVLPTLFFYLMGEQI